MNSTVPADHPVLFELINPLEQKVDNQVQKSGGKNLLVFKTATSADAVTGDYKAQFRIGGASFTKRVRVETIKPNRLKIDLDFPGEMLGGTGIASKGTLKVKWLNGAIAGNLKSSVEYILKPAKTEFEKYGQYTFDDPANEPVLSAMEKAGMILASVHIADPNGPFGNRGNWCADPVEFWRMQMGLERVLQRHPNLIVVAAHGSWLVCQDAQLDFLRYLFKTYPNFYIDLAATDQYYPLVSYDNLRDLFMEYSDRILFGTDIGKLKADETGRVAERYVKSFRILETSDVVKGGFFGVDDIKGLNLPREVLEKIYFRNALEIYPGLKDSMTKLGYSNLNLENEKGSD